MEQIKTDICVVGAGSGGLSVAAVAMQMGAEVVLIEKGKMGGDCLNYGCVPSKSLLAVSKRAAQIKTASAFGIQAHIDAIDFFKVHQYVHDVIAKIAPNDSVERFEKLGVKVIKATASFISDKELEAGNYRIKAKYFVIATGSSPAIPPLPGLDQISFLTNETIFDLTQKPEHLIIIGGGPIGCEMAQAHLNLNVPVTLLVRHRILPKDDPELVTVIRDKLVQQQLNLREDTNILKLEKISNGVTVTFEQGGKPQQISASHLLIATGRQPNLAELNLEKAKINYSKRGIQVNKRLQSSNKRIYAIGDVVGHYQFTHMASYHAGIVIRNMLFRLPAKVNYKAFPWVTYTHPELAQVGLNEQTTIERAIPYKIIRFKFHDNDRAHTEHLTNGLVKAVLNKKGHILGVGIVGASAGELIAPWVMAMHCKIKISAVASLIIPYPTLSEVTKRTASEFFTPVLFSSRMKKIVRFLLSL